MSPGTHHPTRLQLGDDVWTRALGTKSFGDPPPFTSFTSMEVLSQWTVKRVHRPHMPNVSASTLELVKNAHPIVLLLNLAKSGRVQGGWGKSHSQHFLASNCFQYRLNFKNHHKAQKVHGGQETWGVNIFFCLYRSVGCSLPSCIKE